MTRKAAVLGTAAAALLLAAATQAQTLDQTLSGCNGVAPLRTIQANPSTYKSLISTLIPGDRLQLAAGTYTQGLNLGGKNGQPGKCIVVEGPASGSPALFTGSDSWNVVSFKNSSYIAVRYLSIDGLSKLGDGVKAEAGSTYNHHITVERLNMKNFNNTVQTVGVNTKSSAWNWVIRYNTITSTGTGMYLGGSSGQYEFVNSLIEHNLIYGTLGYNIEIKHQLTRNTSLGIPSTATTIVRHNVFYENPYEALFQGEGNIALHDNLMVNRAGTAAIHIQKHNNVPKRIEIWNNTVVAGNTGIQITGADPAYPQRVTGNAVFAATPLYGGQQTGNITGTYAAAATYLNNPTAALGAGLDLYPKTGKLQGTALNLTYLTGFTDQNSDFNGLPRLLTFRGAYSGEGVDPGWLPAQTIKP